LQDYSGCHTLQLAQLSNQTSSLPELPEVETTRSGIAPHISMQRIESVVVREPRLRWPVSPEITELLPGSMFTGVDRRGKYLLLQSEAGMLLAHLGMSGSFRIVTAGTAPRKHDHVDIVFANQCVLRFCDPRRFGCLLWVTGNIEDHALLKSLGPEPLGDEFDAEYLHKKSRGRQVPVKNFIMDSHVVVGVGNIYANEALFMAGIHPLRKAGKVGRDRYELLVTCIRKILVDAIRVGGTTLRDFTNSSGEPGYFKQSLAVYGRAGEPCKTCDNTLTEIRLGQRSTVYCKQCQK